MNLWKIVHKLFKLSLSVYHKFLDSGNLRFWFQFFFFLIGNCTNLQNLPRPLSVLSHLVISLRCLILQLQRIQTDTSRGWFYLGWYCAVWETPATALLSLLMPLSERYSSGLSSPRAVSCGHHFVCSQNVWRGELIRVSCHVSDKPCHILRAMFCEMTLLWAH